MRLRAVVGVLILSAVLFGADPKGDAQLRAMVDELARAKTLHLNDLDKPYFVSYASNDTEQVSLSSSLGGLVTYNSIHLRQPRIQVRVGKYDFDNSNSVFSRPARLPMLSLDDDYQVLRSQLWLSTDALYKAAADQIARKRAALHEISQVDDTPDFAPAPAIEILQPPATLKFDYHVWEARARKVSAAFLQHPAITASQVNVLAVGSTYRLAN